MHFETGWLLNSLPCYPRFLLLFYAWVEIFKTSKEERQLLNYFKGRADFYLCYWIFSNESLHFLGAWSMILRLVLYLVA